MPGRLVSGGLVEWLLVIGQGPGKTEVRKRGRAEERRKAEEKKMRREEEKKKQGSGVREQGLD